MRWLVVFLLALLLACGPPFEVGTVLGTQFTPGHNESRQRSVYVTDVCIGIGYDGNLTTTPCQRYVGEETYLVWIPDQWTLSVAGENDAGQRLTEEVRLNFPENHPPAAEGDRFSLVEMKVVRDAR